MLALRSVKGVKTFKDLASSFCESISLKLVLYKLKEWISFSIRNLKNQ